MIATIATQQVLALRRQRIFMALLATFLVMTALAGVIGWLSHETIVRVYDDAVKILAAEGEPAPASPFDLKPPLSLLSNMAIYVPLIGALMALVLGHISIADDRSDGLGRLMFTRSASRSRYLVGKLLATSGVLAAICLLSLVVSAISLLIVNRTAPTVGEIARLFAFYSLSWLYLLAFALVGVVTALVVRRRSLALLTGLGVWLVLTFAVPQFTSGLLPTAALNPITNPVSTSQAFFRMTSKARPFSVSEQYRTTAAQLLGTSPGESALDASLRLAPLIVVVLGLIALCVVLVGRHDYSKVDDDA